MAEPHTDSDDEIMVRADYIGPARFYGRDGSGTTYTVVDGRQYVLWSSRWRCGALWWGDRVDVEAARGLLEGLGFTVVP